MHHVYVRNPEKEYPLSILIKEAAFNTDNIPETYLDPFIAGGIAEDFVISYSLEFTLMNKVPVKLISE